MVRIVSQRSQEGIGLIETVIAALLMGITVSGSIFIAAELSRSGVDARVRAGALDVSSSRIEAALYEGAGFGDLSSYNTTQGAVSNASYGIETNSDAISSTADWSFQGADEQVALSNAHFYDSELIENVAQGGSGDLVESSDGEGESNDGSSTDSGENGSGNDNAGNDSDSGDSGDSEQGGTDEGDNGDDSDQSGNTNWTATILVNVDQGGGLDQPLDASITPNSGYDSGACGEAGANESFVCSINVLTTTTWAGMLSIEVVGGGGNNPDVICNGDTDGGDDPATFVIGLTQANPSASVTIRQEDKASKCDDDEGPVVIDAAVTVSTSLTNGSASPSQQLVFLGQTASIGFTPDTGYQIATDGISGCNGTDSSTSPYTTGSLTQDCTVTAVLTQVEYLVSAADGTNGTVSPGSQTVANGGGTSFSVTPDTSHTLTGVSTSGGCSASVSGNNLVVSSVTGACTVTPTYTIKSYTMTATAGTGIDTVAPAAQSVTHGDAGQVSVTLATGYESPVASGCGDGAVSGGVFESNALTADCSVSISATKINYTVTAVGGSNGSISPATAEVPYNEGATFTVTPDSSHTLTGVGTSGNCSAVLSGNDVVVSSVTGACTVTPTYTIKSYTMTATAGTGIDTVAPASQSVAHGDAGQVSVTLATGYESPVASGCGDGAISGATFTSYALTSSCSVTISASKIDYTVTAVNITNGSGSSSEEVPYQEGASFTVTPADGYTLTGASATSGCAVDTSGNSLVVSDVTADCTVTPTYTQDVNEWTANLSIFVDDKAGSADDWNIEVEGCTPSSYQHSGGDYTFTCAAQITAATANFTVNVTGMQGNSLICTGNRSGEEDLWTDSFVLSPELPNYEAELVLEDKARRCGTNEAPAITFSAAQSEPVELDTDTFDSGNDGWSGDIDQIDGQLAVGEGQGGEKKADKEFEFSGYGGREVQVTLEVSTVGFESSDKIRIYADGENGETVLDWTSSVSSPYTFTVELDSSGKFKLELYSDTNKNNEYALFDNITIVLLDD